MPVKRLQLVVATTAALAVTAGAHADLVPDRNSPGVTGGLSVSGEAAPGEGMGAQFARELLEGVFPRPNRPLSVWPAEHLHSKGSTGDSVLSVPAGPGSASLFLFALGGLGAWNLGRSARKLHLGCLPEWYHSGGPRQVGHATPLDLDFHLATAPLCRLEVPAAIGGNVSSQWWSWRERAVGLSAQQVLHSADPRGPPPYP
jgi:hypothetical protein